MSSSSGGCNDVCGRGIVHRRGGRGGRGIGRGGVLEDPLPLCPGLHVNREVTLPMGDPRCVANVVIKELKLICFTYNFFSFHMEHL
jgi:hypothetical protein